jgi:hypothetical protein
MKDSNSSDRPAAGAQREERTREAQPWHAADEKPASPAGGDGAPIGTHSFTGGGAKVGQPTASEDVKAERGAPRDELPGAEEPDPMAEPRADIGQILGRKP